MVNTRSQKDQHSLADSAQTIPAMLGGRVRKRRAPSSATLPLKRAKTTHTNTLPPKAQVASCVTELPTPPSGTKSKTVKPPATTLSNTPSKARNGTSRPPKSQRQLRLSEMLKRDRQQRLERSAPPPAFVIAPLHVDAKRPHSRFSSTDSPSRTFDSSVKSAVESAPSTPKRLRHKACNDSQLISLLSSPVTRHPPTSSRSETVIPVDRTKSERVVDSFVTASSLASTRVRSSGSEAIAYSPALLPVGHVLLLDIFSGIETAVNLLRTRHEFTTFGAVRSVVAKSSKRDFTFRHLSQLAHIVPEALSVLPPRNSRLTGRDHLILRLDDVGDKSSAEANVSAVASKVGGAATRARHRLLHDRLLQHVREHHESFLKKRGVTSFESNFWHQEFDLEVHVPQLGAPPLYPSPLPKTRQEPVKSTEATKACDLRLKQKAVDEAGKSKAEEKENDRLESCIPTGLLERVRARSQARNEMVMAKEADYRTKPEYFARLPATMDTISAILRTGKRQAFGWAMLVMRLRKEHPKHWDAKEIERQLDSIAEHAPEWCRKVTLSGPKLRYAFRIVDERKFAKQRAKVVEVGNNL